MLIKEKFPTKGVCDSALWFNAAGHYTIARWDGSNLYMQYFDEDEKVITLAEWLFGFKFKESGYAIADLRETLHHYAGEWFTRPGKFPKVGDEPGFVSFRSLYIGELEEVFAWESPRDGSMLTETSPEEHGDTVDEYKVYANRYWVRTDDIGDRRYDGPYDSAMHALQAAVSDYF